MGNYKFFKVCLGAGSRQYCRYTKSPLGITPLKEIWESPRVKENLTSVGFEPTTSGLDLPMLYRLSYEASTGAGRGNITKTESNNCFIIHWRKKMEVMFLLLHWQETKCMKLTRDPWPWVSLTWSLYNLQLWCHGHWFPKFTVRLIIDVVSIH